METERKKRGQSVPLPLRITMLKLLRLLSFRLCASKIPENSTCGRR